jgi:hypothetical protein
MRARTRTVEVATMPAIMPGEREWGGDELEVVDTDLLGKDGVEDGVLS